MADPSGAAAAPSEQGLGLLELMALLLDHRALLAALSLGFGAAALVVAMLMHPLYKAETTFVPETRQASLPAGLSSIAGQFGLSVGNQGSQSPYFYGDLLRSREVMTQVLRTRFRRPGRTDSAALLDILPISATTPRSRLDKALRKLDDRLGVIVDEQTNVVHVAVEMPGPQLAADVANRFVVALDSFNQVTRRSQGRAQRVFAEDQLTEAQHALNDAEDALRTFLVRNRSYQGWPQLELEYERLQRQVTMRQEVYQNLYREYESARLEEVNDTPIITVMDSAVAPTRKSKPVRWAFTVLGLTFGALLGLFIVLLRHYVARLRVMDGPGVRALGTAWRRARARRSPRSAE